MGQDEYTEALDDLYRKVEEDAEYDATLHMRAAVLADHHAGTPLGDLAGLVSRLAARTIPWSDREWTETEEERA